MLLLFSRIEMRVRAASNILYSDRLAFSFGGIDALRKETERGRFLCEQFWFNCFKTLVRAVMNSVIIHSLREELSKQRWRLEMILLLVKSFALCCFRGSKSKLVIEMSSMRVATDSCFDAKSLIREDSLFRKLQ
jgi:hypothetical protein